MATEQLLLHLPEELVRRFKRTVPARSRSAFVRVLLEKALPAPDDDEDPLFLAALDVERDAALKREMAEWETAMSGDGLTELEILETPPEKQLR